MKKTKILPADYPVLAVINRAQNMPWLARWEKNVMTTAYIGRQDGVHRMSFLTRFNGKNV